MKKIGFVATILVAIFAAAYSGYDRFVHGRTMKEPLSPIISSEIRIEIPCPFYVQSDPLWKEQEIGVSGDTLENYGCTICSAAMALGAYNIDINPSDLTRLLSQEGGFTENGLLIWDSLAEVAGTDFKVEVRNSFDAEYLNECLSRGDPIIAKVLFDDRIWHWVLIVGRGNGSYLIKDPLNSDGVVKASETYPGGFYAIRHLRRG